jgi:hypothetical protein
MERSTRPWLRSAKRSSTAPVLARRRFQHWPDPLGLRSQRATQRDRQRQHALPHRQIGAMRSTRFAAVCHIRIARHDGQNPQRLQLKASSLSWPQSPKRTLRKRWPGRCSLRRRRTRGPTGSPYWREGTDPAPAETLRRQARADGRRHASSAPCRRLRAGHLQVPDGARKALGPSAPRRCCPTWTASCQRATSTAWNSWPRC